MTTCGMYADIVKRIRNDRSDLVFDRALAYVTIRSAPITWENRRALATWLSVRRRTVTSRCAKNSFDMAQRWCRIFLRKEVTPNG